MKVEIINKSGYELPKYETLDSAGMDIRNAGSGDYLPAKGSIIISTGLYVSIPKGYEIEIRGRSGLAFKYDIIAHNGTLDSDFRGEIKIKLFNLGSEGYIIKPGERIAQMILNKLETIEWQEVEELNETERGNGGFGHSGKD